MSDVPTLEAFLGRLGLPIADARDPEAVARHADDLLEDGRYAEAVGLLAAALHVHPDHWPLRSLAGWAWFRLGDKRSAEDAFFEAVRRGGGAHEVAMLARCYAENGTDVAAAVGLCRALRLPDPPAWLSSRHHLVEPVRRGEPLVAAGRSILAEHGADPLLRWLSEQDPELVDVDFDLRRLRGQAAVRLGRWADVVETLAPLVLVAPDDGEMCAWAAEAWLETGDVDRARFALDAAGPGTVPESERDRLLARIEQPR